MNQNERHTLNGGESTGNPHTDRVLACEAVTRRMTEAEYRDGAPYISGGG